MNAEEFSGLVLNILGTFPSVGIELASITSSSSVPGSIQNFTNSDNSNRKIIYEQSFDPDANYEPSDNNKLSPEAKSFSGFSCVFSYTNHANNKVMNCIINAGSALRKGDLAIRYDVEYFNEKNIEQFKELILCSGAQISMIQNDELSEELELYTSTPIGWYTWINQPFFTYHNPLISSAP